MFDHVTIRASDLDSSRRFYDTVFEPIGIERTHGDDSLPEWDDFSMAAASDDKPVTRRLHVGFVAPDRQHVDEFWRVGTDAGYRDDGAPGERQQYLPDYYGAFLLDPDGNSVEAVHYESKREGGNIDHVWMRVADVAASKRFYETIAPFAGIRLSRDDSQRATLTGKSSSLTLLSGIPTEHVHLAFPATDNATVDAFHRTATEAGYADNGQPGERPIYHPGYYGAFVLDPDGNNIEVVNHNRST